jgi:uncharacterized membrane protein
MLGEEEHPPPRPRRPSHPTSLTPAPNLRRLPWYNFFVNVLPSKSLKVLLIVLVIFWILEILGTATIARLLEHADSYPFKCRHSGLIFVLTTTLRALTRCLFPLALTIAFYYVLKERSNGPDIDRLMQEINQEEHSMVLRKVVRVFVDKNLAARPPREIMNEFHGNLSDDLNALCYTALFSGILLTLPMIALGATNYPSFTYRIPGVRFLHVFDILSHLIRNCFCGLMFAFFFFEIKLKFLITGISKADELLSGDRELDDPAIVLGPELHREAVRTASSLSFDWCSVEIFLQFASGVYTMLLLVSASSGLPFSCGISVNPDDFPYETAVHWLWFVALMVFFHIISTSVFVIPLVRPVGVVLQILGVMFLFYSFEETAIFAHYLQILYALIPMVYCFWFHVLTIVHEFTFALNCTENRHPHLKRLAYSTFLLLVMVVIVIAAIWNEYTNLNSSGGFHNTWVMPQMGKVPHERSCHSNGHLYKDICMCESTTNGSPCACLSQFFS